MKDRNMFVFLDESGNFSGDKDDYFIIGGFLTGTPRRTAKEFRKWQQKKFPKKLRRKNEVKFSDTGLNNELRLKTLAYFAKQDIRIFYTFLKKENIPPEYRNKKSIEGGLLYTEIVAKSINLLVPTTELEFRVFRDKRHLGKISQEKFNETLKLDILPKLPAKSLFQINAVDSGTTPNVQIADWICGALFRYYNKRRNGDRFYATVKNSIVASDELFKNYWTNKKSR